MVLLSIPAAHPEKAAVVNHSARCIHHRSDGRQEEALVEVDARSNRNNTLQLHDPWAVELPQQADAHELGPVALPWRHLRQRTRHRTLDQVPAQVGDDGGDSAGEHSHHIHHHNIRSDRGAVEEERPSLLLGGRRGRNEEVEVEAGHELNSSAAAAGVLHGNRAEAAGRDIHEEEGDRDGTGASSRDRHREHHHRHREEGNDPVRGWCHCCYRHWDPMKQTTIRTRR